MKIRTFAALFVVLLLFTGITAYWSEAKAADEEFITVTVKEGDTLSGIAKKYLKNPSQYMEILKFNGLENPDFIKAGTKLKIPVQLLKESPQKPETKPTPKPAPTTPSTPPPKRTETTPPVPAIPPRPEALGVIFHVAKDAIRTSAAGADETLKVGSVIKSGDRVVTDTLSFCSISLGAGRLVVGPDSRLVVEQIGKDQQGGTMFYIKLIRGSLNVDSPAGLDLRIRSQVAVIRAHGAGFTFRVEEEGRTFTEIYSGKADITSASSRHALTGGQGVVVDSGGAASAPTNLPVTPVMVGQEVQSEGELHQGAVWKQASEAVSYRVEVALDSYFEKPVYFAGYAGDSIDFNFLASYPSGRYYIRLISVNKNGLWSAPSNASFYTSQTR